MLYFEEKISNLLDTSWGTVMISEVYLKCCAIKEEGSENANM